MHRQGGTCKQGHCSGTLALAETLWHSQVPFVVELSNGGAVLCSHVCQRKATGDLPGQGGSREKHSWARKHPAKEKTLEKKLGVRSGIFMIFLLWNLMLVS